MNNVTFTENGAISNRSTMDANLDWFFHGPAMRKAPNSRIVEMFAKAFEQDAQTALRTLFYIRDIRGGQGERDIFRACINFLSHNKNTSDWLMDNITLIAEYGRWDDYLVLLNSPIKQLVANFLFDVLKSDIETIESDDKTSISLCAKWMPTETSGLDSKKQVKELVKLFRNIDSSVCYKSYRQMISKLRKHINLVETNLTTKEYGNIEYQQVPSLAMTKYRRAFARNDHDRFSTYMELVKIGKKKINANTSYPYDLIKPYLQELTSYFCNVKEDDKVLEEQWKALPDYVPEINGLVVADTSGSMTWNNNLPLAVSISLAIYIAERNKSEVWKNYVIPFSASARWIQLTGETLHAKARQVYTGDCSNTNLQSVFNLILTRATENNCPKEDMPKVLLIISDMEFDETSNNLTNFETIRSKYKDAGYDLPQLVWWNVASRNTQTPITKNDNGNILLSGCSPAVLTTALSGEFNPIEAMNRVVNAPRYEKIIYSAK